MEMFTGRAATWMGILFCLSQSGLFSGLNLAYFSITRLRLEVESSTGNEKAKRILDLRSDYHHLLATILWGNVAVNVLLALLTDSVMSGVAAFLFSTVVITFVGEIIPQAVFSRYAMTIGYWLAPVMQIYRVLLYPVAKPVAVLLDVIVGKEGIHYFREPDLKQVIREHVEEHRTDIGFLEGVGALNFLTMDDIMVGGEGNMLSGDSIVELERWEDGVRFPAFESDASDPFLQKLQKPGKNWIVFVDENQNPHQVINVTKFFRRLYFDSATPLREYCHEPLVVRDPSRSLGTVLKELEVYRPKKK